MRFCPAYQNAPQELKPQLTITLLVGWFPIISFAYTLIRDA